MANKKDIKNAIKCTVAMATVIVLLCSVFVLNFQINTKAVAYSGSGTKKDPYLVQNAEQLNGMRENLSAHYKLANTIDMASFGKFTPIGLGGDVFTGSFTCEANSDGTPKYAIKNLSVYNDSGEKYGHKIGTNAGYVDYKQGKSKWQAGLFGKTKGATITNIAVLNADIVNTVVGQNNMNKDFSLNYGMDEQGTGILIGIAESTAVSGCIATGKVNSKSNSTGGLIGSCDEASSVTYCYSTAMVTNAGYWNTGGLVGSVKGSLSCSFATGDVKGGATEPTTASLCGNISATATVSSCYATGAVLSDSNGHNFIGFDNGKDVPDGMYFCYFTGSVKGYTGFDNAGKTASEQNLYALKGAAGRQAGFSIATADEIKSKFAASADWDVSGELPTLKKISIIKDESIYVPGAVSEVPSQDSNNSVTAGTESQGGTTEEKVGVDELVEKMNALPDDPDNVSMKHYEDIYFIKQGYEKLGEDELTKIPVDSLTKYNQALNKIIPLVMADIKKQVNDLPDIKKLTAKDYDAVMSIQSKFEFIGENSEFMEEAIIKKLESAVKKVKELNKNAQSNSSSEGISLIEWILIGVICLFIISAITVEVIWTYSVCKRIKSLKTNSDLEDQVLDSEQ